MKYLVLCFLIITLELGLNAQEKGKIRVGGSIGVALPNFGGGISGDLDIRYNILDNFNAGFRLGSGLMIKDVYIASDKTSMTATESLNNSFIMTGDYYFHNRTSIFAAFLGAGLGTFYIENTRFTLMNNEVQRFDFSINGENIAGGLLRGGFEIGKFRMALEYYLIPNSAMNNVQGNYISETNNNYLNLSLGFYLGGGKWRKPSKALL